MTKVSLVTLGVVSGLLATATVALPQYTMSAKPGAVNYVEGNATLNGQPVGGGASLRSTFLNAGDLLETQDGKVEVLLTPGIFLRVGEHSAVRMLKPSLADTQISIEAGESMVEVDQWVKDSHVVISMRGGVTEFEKTGLYRFVADGEPSVAVIDGKAQVTFGSKHAGVGKGHEALLSDALKTRAFDKDRDDDLFAWSNIRSQYNASLTYQAAKSAASGGGGGGYSSYTGYGSSAYGYGYGYTPGWFWNSGFNSWLWMPGSYFYSPFGWGFYGPGYVMYAPVVTVPVTGTGTVWKPTPKPRPTMAGIGGTNLTVPVNPRHMPAINSGAITSPSRLQAASAQTARTVATQGGLQTPTGAPVPRNSGFGNGGGGPVNRSSGGSYNGGGAGRSGGGSAGGSVSHASGGSFGGGGGGASHASGGGGSASHK